MSFESRDKVKLSLCVVDMWQFDEILQETNICMEVIFMFYIYFISPLYEVPQNVQLANVMFDPLAI